MFREPQQDVEGGAESSFSDGIVYTAEQVADPEHTHSNDRRKQRMKLNK